MKNLIKPSFLLVLGTSLIISLTAQEQVTPQAQETGVIAHQETQSSQEPQAAVATNVPTPITSPTTSAETPNPLPEQGMVPYGTESTETPKTEPEAQKTAEIAQPLVVSELPQPPVMQKPEESAAQPQKEVGVQDYKEAFKKINDLIDQINEIILKLK